MAQTRFQIEHQVSRPGDPLPGPALWLQWGRYRYADATVQQGYRFVWTRDDGSVQARGPARIPSLDDVLWF